jgi:L-threonylcarbamoyladenylate synthase
MFTEIETIVKLLQNGQTILYPTDTIWGIGCDCTNKAAVQKVYTLKKRPDTKSLILLVDSIEMLQNYTPVSAEKLQKLHGQFTRPLTVIYSETTNLPDFLKAEDGSIAMRVAQDPFCQAIIAAFGKPIVSTSANISGEPTPKNFKEIEATIKKNVDYTVLYRQNDNDEREPSILVRYHAQTDELDILRA